MRSGTKLGLAAVLTGALVAVGWVGASSAQVEQPGGLDPVGVTDGGMGGVGGTGSGPYGAVDAGTPELPDPAIPNGSDLPDNTYNRPQSGTESVPPTSGSPPPVVPSPLGGADGGM